MNASLNSRWSMVAFVPDVVSNGRDKNISLIEGFSIVGFSYNDSLNISDLKFTPSGESTLTWSQAVSQGKVQAYFMYREDDRYKYSAPANLRMNDYALRPGRAYWLKANVAGILTLPGVGDNTDLSANYTDLELKSDTTTRSITDISTNGEDWVFDSTGDTNIMQHYHEGYLTVCGVPTCDNTTVSTWEGIWIYGNQANVNVTANISTS